MSRSVMKDGSERDAAGVVRQEKIDFIRNCVERVTNEVSAFAVTQLCRAVASEASRAENGEWLDELYNIAIDNESSIFKEGYTSRFEAFLRALRSHYRKIHPTASF